jgi:hypothetical protein
VPLMENHFESKSISSIVKKQSIGILYRRYSDQRLRKNSSFHRNNVQLMQVSTR